MCAGIVARQTAARLIRYILRQQRHDLADKCELGLECVFVVRGDDIGHPDESAIGPSHGYGIGDEIDLVPVLVGIDPAPALVPKEIEHPVRALAHDEPVHLGLAGLAGGNRQLVNVCFLWHPAGPRQALAGRVYALALALGLEIPDINIDDFALRITVLPHHVVVDLQNFHGLPVYALIADSGPIPDDPGKARKVFSRQGNVRATEKGEGEGGV